MSTRPTLAYWAARGTAQPIRYLLKYAGVDFNDKRYDGDNKDSWFSVKPNLGLEFPNLPYYTDGDIKLTQSLAILRYLGRKHRLVATDDQTLARQDMAEQQIEDMRIGFMLNIVYTDNSEAKMVDYMTGTLKSHLDLLVKFLGDKQWLTGQLSYVDFMAYTILEIIKKFSAETIGKYSTISRYVDRFEALAPIKAYLSSTEFKSLPRFGHKVKWE
ncbi:unnamed protein product [Oppiella nova]|uniref:glutathione transferase n=1 Tax=Oppiella nova TaxID=334625 RepID=A0A7R9QPD5_9ACAR|nr:unnamed protein product [Oppiella nova]CAG2170542.1 unnamed protein product [Oppiella nova]